MPLPMSGVQVASPGVQSSWVPLRKVGVSVLRAAGLKKARAKHRKPTFQLSPPTAGLDACSWLIASSHHVGPGSGALGSLSWLARLASENVAAHNTCWLQMRSEELMVGEYEGWCEEALPHGKRASLGAAPSPECSSRGGWSSHGPAATTEGQKEPVGAGDLYPRLLPGGGGR